MEHVYIFRGLAEGGAERARGPMVSVAQNGAVGGDLSCRDRQLAADQMGCRAIKGTGQRQNKEGRAALTVHMFSFL